MNPKDIVQILDAFSILRRKRTTQYELSRMCAKGDCLSVFVYMERQGVICGFTAPVISGLGSVAQ
ncbi:MAG: hypothetical protein V5789_09660 [Colwellia sp.]